MRRHGGETDREQAQNDADRQVGDRGADAAEEDGERGDTRHHGEGGGGRHNEEEEEDDDVADAECGPLQMAGRLRPGSR
ncbi:hypothetical protein [Streptomyces phaeochromogenes]